MNMTLVVYDTLPIKKAEPEEPSESSIPKVPKQYSRGVEIFNQYAKDPKVQGMRLFITPSRELYGLGTEPGPDGRLNRVLWRFGKGDMGRGMMRVLTVPDDLFDTRLEDIKDKSMLQSAIPTWFQAHDYDRDNFSNMEGFKPTFSDDSNGRSVGENAINEYYGRIYSRPVVDVGYDYTTHRLNELIDAINTGVIPPHLLDRKNASLPDYGFEGPLLTRQRIAGPIQNPALNYVETEGAPTPGEEILSTLPDLPNEITPRKDIRDERAKKYDDMKLKEEKKLKENAEASRDKFKTEAQAKIGKYEEERKKKEEEERKKKEELEREFMNTNKNTKKKDVPINYEDGDLLSIEDILSGLDQVEKR